ncbi:MAG: hypothetical protein J6K84_03090 [Oscillospiraceae bacterium]|nr:hypothetical protein [Oscillospiraceae bacterium]
MKKTIIVIAVCVVLLGIVADLFGFGLFPRYDVYLSDYRVSADGSSLTFAVGVSSPAGYVRKMDWKQTNGTLYLDFYPAFGGINGNWGAQNQFTVPLHEETTTISVCRGTDVYVEILRKDFNGNWLDAREVDLENLKTIYHADQPIFEGPSYDTNYLGVIETAGNYAFPEVAKDDEGNLWGHLADGRGWVDLTYAEESKDAPLTAGFAWKSLLDGENYHEFIGSEHDYTNDIALIAHDTLTDFTLYGMTIACSLQVDRELFSLETLTPEKPLVATLMFPGDLTTYGIGFICDGTEYFYTISLSGRNGTVVFQPFTPSNLHLFRS